MAQYGKTAYWDERYTKDPEPFDWYQRYSGIRELIAQYVRKEDNVLCAGCGNSRLSEDMYEDGYGSIANIDISRVVIDQMVDKYKERPSITWQQMNVCSLEFPDESYDAVIAKGTLVSLRPPPPPAPRYSPHGSANRQSDDKATQQPNRLHRFQISRKISFELEKTTHTTRATWEGLSPSPPSGRPPPPHRRKTHEGMQEGWGGLIAARLVQKPPTNPSKNVFPGVFRFAP